jgi:hypothetical protein
MPTPNTDQRDFDEEFEQAVTEWRQRHRLRECGALRADRSDGACWGVHGNGRGERFIRSGQ